MLYLKRYKDSNSKFAVGGLNMSDEMEREHFTSKSGEASLIAGQCNSCKQYYFPYQETCKVCMESIERRNFSEGRLHSFTVIHTPAPGFEPPYTVGYIDLNDDFRVFGQIISESGEKPKIDSKVKVIYDQSSCKENDNLNFKFKSMDEVLR